MHHEQRFAHRTPWSVLECYLYASEDPVLFTVTPTVTSQQSSLQAIAIDKMFSIIQTVCM